MTLEQFQKDVAAFNLWANNRIIQWLKTHPSDLTTREIPSSFPSIRLTLAHIWDAEEVWLDRLNGRVPAYDSHEDFTGPIEDLYEGLLDNSKMFVDYVNGLTIADLETVCDFHKMDGTPDSRPRFEMIQHCLNHSTYHRGQIITMARSLGLENPPNTDFMGYVRSKSAV